MESTSIGDYEASDASRCAPSSITGYETDNYWQRDELSRIERVGVTKKKKKKKREKEKKYIESKVPRIFPFRDSISGFCCFALSAHTERLDVYRNYSFAGSTYRDRGGGDRVPRCLLLLRFIGPAEIFVWQSWIKLYRIVVRVELETLAFLR